MVSHSMDSNGNGVAPKITLYTNHQCPYAHRSHIALKELGLQYEEVMIDLNTPREPWYLDINPRGLVPTLRITNPTLNNETITESAIVCQFISDLYPSHLMPDAPLARARINFFIDTWNTKVSTHLFTILKAESDDEKAEKCRPLVAAVGKEIEPLLEGCAPFIGGRERLSLAEINAGPFLLRLYTLANAGLLPKTLPADLDAMPNFAKWAKAVRGNASVNEIYDEEQILVQMRKTVEKFRAMK